MLDDGDDDTPHLSADTLAALQAFYEEQAERQQQEAAIQEGKISKGSLQEDWQLSQFWYTDETATRLAEEALSVMGDNGKIACISSPTAYKKIKELCPPNCEVRCLEYDTRFSMFREDFLFYDYKEPLRLPAEWRNRFDIVIADPPFLSEECLCKVAQTVRFLTIGKVILNTGAILQETALKLLGVRPCGFLPQHVGLQNEFLCYTNYDSKLLSST
ncbi:EEF1A lysine methyltransferase 1-like [Dreissena polymorpha]|uniref:Protein-lysine N-methyltransferase DPMN_044969 n=1 Tax=Dreissena polymorpha TaxID=45954 RepID=A0A9D4D5E1_DREPO|nr:EEF1A lysine methyltransferase 1-like [Dreissena polymorpha]KAH3738335.1 hypothetical protein DPMN_044969 [Dreissena polymorpha]